MFHRKISLAIQNHDAKRNTVYLMSSNRTNVVSCGHVLEETIKWRNAHITYLTLTELHIYVLRSKILSEIFQKNCRMQ